MNASRSALAATVAALAALIAYVLTAPSAPASSDYAEAQTVPYILGIPHQTGFPAYVLAGWAFAHGFAVGTVAWRLNLFAGLCTAVATGGVALLAAELGANAVAAACGALLFAFCPAAWFAGTHADPHALLLALFVFGLVFALRYARRGDGRDLVAGGICCGLGLATHPFALFLLVALAAALLARRGASRRAVVLALAAVLLPLALYAYLPLRSAYVAADGLDPTAAPPLSGAGTIAWDTNHPRTLGGFLDETLGRKSDAAPQLLGSVDPRLLVERWLGFVPYLRTEMHGLGTILAFLGALALALRDPRAWLVTFCALLPLVAFTFAYAIPDDVPRYLVPAFALAAALAAAAARLPLVPARLARPAAIVITAALAFAAAGGFAADRAEAAADRSGPGGQPIIDEVARAVPDGAVVVAPWEDATTLAYGAFVERALGSRIVVVGWPRDFAPDYPAWTATKRVFVFGGRGVALDPMATLGPARIARLWTAAGLRYLYEMCPARDRPGADQKYGPCFPNAITSF